MQYLEIFALVLGFVIGYLTCFVVTATMKRPVNRRVATPARSMSEYLFNDSAWIAKVAAQATPDTPKMRGRDVRPRARPFRVTGEAVYNARDYAERFPRRTAAQLKKALKLPYNASTIGVMIRIAPTGSVSQDQRIANYDKMEADYIESVE